MSTRDLQSERAEREQALRDELAGTAAPAHTPTDAECQVMARGSVRDPNEPFVQERRGLLWLCEREILRFLKLWVQTLTAPVVSSLLFILVFGLALGDAIADVNGIPYKEFIVPGLVVQAVLTAAFSNNSSSMMQSRLERFINDVLSSPLRWWEVNIGLGIGGVARGLLTGVLLTILAVVLTGVGIANPLVLVVATVLVLIAFAQGGLIAGVYANSWDAVAFITSLVLLPLSFLGGTFYSVDKLPAFWEAISHVNPIFYVVQAYRTGFLGEADVSAWVSLGVIAAFAAGLTVWAGWLFKSGHRLKP